MQTCGVHFEAAAVALEPWHPASPVFRCCRRPFDLLLAESKAEAIKRVKSAGTLGDHGGGAGELVLRFFAKTAILVVSVFILSDYAEKIPRLALEYLYGKLRAHFFVGVLHILENVSKLCC